MAQFLLNQNPHPIDLTTIDANTTVLQFLRTNGWVGTKEGCASGDCGACTAVVMELSVDKQQVEYKTLNTCIALVHHLKGKWLLTVEGLQKQDELHPVQQAMVDCHGSQCGYCTPGFIMSMYCWFVNHQQVSRDEIEHSLAGNLCRCTGYQPIIESCYQAMQRKTHYEEIYNASYVREEFQKHQLALSHQQSSPTIQSELLTPTSIEKLSQLIDENPTARIIAGGTDLGLEITLFSKSFKQIISVQYVPELKVIKDDGDEISISAGVTLNQALSLMIKYFPNIEQYLYRFASMQIRYWATVCGNIANASPIGDLAPILLVLNAQLMLRKGKKIRQIALQDFFIDYKKTALQQGEWIQAIIIPKPKEQENLYVYKLSKRFDDDISTVSVAIKISSDREGYDIEGIEIAFGGIAAIPKKAPLLSDLLMSGLGNKLLNPSMDQINALSSDIQQVIKREFTPLSDMRASAKYRVHMAGAIVQKALLDQANNPVK